MTGSLISRGFLPDLAQQMANRGIYGALLRQAALLSFMDCFRWLGVTCLVCAPLVLLFKKGRPGAAPVHID